MSALRREVRFEAMGGTVKIRWLLHGDNGTTQFLVSTGWRADWIQGEQSDVAWIEPRHLAGGLYPSAHDFGHHWDEATYEDEYQPESCDVRPAGRCFYDGSALYADKVFARLLREGGEAVWSELEDYYRELSEKAGKP